MSQFSEIENDLKSLRMFADSKNLQSALNTIEIIGSYLDEQNLSDAKIDLAFQLLFATSNRFSLISFLKKKIEEKFLNKCKLEVFRLIKKLISRHPKIASPYVKGIIDIATKYATSVAYANEREISLQVILDIISNYQFDISDINIAGVIQDLLKIFDERNLTNRFLQYNYELLGTLSKRFPEEWLESDALKFRQTLITQIENLYLDDKNIPSMFVIAGAVDGLRNHLRNYCPKPDETKIVEDIYRIMKELSDPSKINIRDKVAFRNTLALFSEHGKLVSHHIFLDYMFWDKTLKQWVKRENKDDRQAGIQAIYNFHKIVSEEIQVRSQTEDKAVLVYFMNNFKDCLQSSLSLPHEVRIAIKGIGLMAGPYRVLLTSNYLIELFDLVMERTEYSYDTKDRMKRREVLEHLPAYIESLSSIASHIAHLSDLQLLALQYIIIILIKDFHYLSSYHHYAVTTSLLKTFKNLQNLGGKFLDACLGKIILQGIIYTCSHQLVYDLMENIESVTDWKETITYKKYLPLWKPLLYDAREFKEESNLVYKNFMQSLFEILNKLNLKTRKRQFKDAEGGDREFFFNDPSIDLEPVNSKDFMIFYNLVEFCWDLITTQSVNCLEVNFLPYIEEYVTFMCEKSIRFPLVSGFLRFLEIGLHVIQRLQYLTEVLIEIAETPKKHLQDLLTNLLRHVISLVHRATGELQISCLRVIFTMPLIVLKDFVNELPEIFKIGFTLGKSMLWLASRALVCFENIIQSSNYQADFRQKLLESVLPCFDTYFQTKIDTSLITTKKIGSRSVRKFKNQEFKYQSEDELVVFQRKLLAFLGNFGPDECLHMIQANHNQQLVQENTLIFRLKLHSNDELSPVILLDSTIKRLCELTKSSTDRATKVSAGEMLHAIVLYKIGTPSQLENDESELWRLLMEQMIVLGANTTDMTFRQLFEPLLMQIVHYYTHSNRIGSQTTTVIVETLYAMISNQDPSIQDLSARLLRELIIWSIRQTSPAQRNATPVKLVDVFHELKKMSVNVDENRRRGATLAFNNIYRIIREEETLINTYWLYLLDIFCTNFKTSENLTDDSVQCRNFEQISASLDHLVRVFVGRQEIFKKTDLDRIKPAGFQGILIPDLVLWLFEQCGSVQSNYRNKIMEVFLKVTNGCWSLDQFITNSMNLQKILYVGENGGIADKADLNFIKSAHTSQIREIFWWIQQLEKSLDFYAWVFKEDIIQDDDFMNFCDQSKIFQAIIYYLKNVNSAAPINILQMINENSLESTQLSLEFHTASQELSKMRTLKCSVLLKIIEFFTTLLPKQNILDGYLLENRVEIVKLLTELIFRPQYFDLDDPTLQLQSKLNAFLEKCILHSPEEFRKYMTNTVLQELATQIENVTDNCATVLASNHIEQKKFNILNGIELLSKHLREFEEHFPTNETMFLKTSAELLLNQLLGGITEQVEDELHALFLSSIAKKYATKLMEILLNIDDFLTKIIQNILNGVLLKKSSNLTIKHGEHFLEIFQKPIFNYFTSRIEESLDLLVGSISGGNSIHIIQIITELNEFIYKYKLKDENFLNTNINVMFGKWPAILECTNQLENENSTYIDMALINLLLHLGMNSPMELHLLGRNLIGMESWLLNLISKKENTLELKTRALPLLACVTSKHDQENEEISKTLLQLQEKHIPLNSREFKEDSLEYAGLVGVIKNLLNVLVLSKSPIILKFLIESTVADDNHILEGKIMNSLREFMINEQKEYQLYVCQMVFEMFQNENLEPSCRLTIISRFLLVLLKNSMIDTVMDFFQNNIQKINSLISSTQTPPDGSGWKVAHGFVNRCGGFLIIETFVGIVPKTTIHEKTFAWRGSLQGKQFLNDLIKLTRNVHIEIYLGIDDNCRELFRKTQCYAYRALCALVSNTQEKVEVYGICLFKDSSNLWTKLINIRDDNLYSNLSQDFEEYPRSKECIVSIKETLSTMQTADSQKASDKYIRTISIFESSLSQSLTKTDLNYSAVLSNREIEERSIESLQKTLKVNLESTPINEHEIMSVLVAVINHIFGNKITPSVVNTNTNEKLWYNMLADSISQSEHKNVRLFLAKLVENCRNHFKIYASVLLGPIIKVIVDKCAGNKLNYFITDLIAMLLSWHEVYIPTTMDEISLARCLLGFLIENAYHDRREIFKLNLELIKKMVELWRDMMEDNLPEQFLLDSLKDPNSARIESAIQLNAIVLANNLIPWSNDSHRNIFLEYIIKCCKNDNAKIHQPAAQLLGMCLDNIIKEAPVEGDENSKILDVIHRFLDNLQQSKNANFKKIIYGIHKNFPLIVVKYLTYISMHIPKSIKKDKLIMLEMFLARLETYSNLIYRQLFAIDLPTNLKHKDYQKISLHIVNKSLDYVTANEAEKLMELIYPLADSFDIECKCLMYEMLIFVYEKFKSQFHDSQKLVKHLLVGLIDSNQEISNRILSFFQKEDILTKSFKDRFLTLLKDFYDPTLEKHFLHYVSFLLLEIPVKHTRSSQPLFEYDPRTSINYFEYQVNTKLNTQSIPPMFLETHQKQLLAGDGSQMQDLIKATQDNNFFTPTQNPDTMIQVSQNYVYKETQNSLYFSLTPQYLDRRSQKVSQDSLEQDMSLDTQIAVKKERTKSKDTAFDYFRQRIIKDKAQASRNQAVRAIEYYDFARVKQEAKARKGSEKNVTLYRRYRMGDYPDLYFNSLALLLPLQALVRKDETIARMVFLEIFNGLMDICRSSNDADAEKEFSKSINESIQVILKSTKNYDAFLFSTLMELVLKSGKYLEISPEIVVNVAEFNNMMVTGILFMESQINLIQEDKEAEDDGESSQAKRVRIDEDQRRMFNWLKLSELYYALSEYEVISGIFADKLNLTPEISCDLNKAIELESEGEFREASRIYSELINKHTDHEAQKEYYYRSFYTCLANLSDWSTIQKKVGKQIGTYDNVWNSSFNVDILLPNLMKGELRQLLINNQLSNEFPRVLESWLEVEDRKEYIFSNFGEEIVMFLVADGQYKKSCVQAERVLKQFSLEWSCLDFISEKLRINKLMDVRNVAELFNFTSQIFSDDELSESGLNKLFNAWTSSNPKVSDSVVTWDTILTYRNYLYKIIERHSESPQDVEKFKNQLLNLQLKVLDVAFFQKNSVYSFYLLRKLSDQIDNEDSQFQGSEISYKFYLALSKYHTLVGEKSNKSMKTRVDNYLKAWHLLDEKLEGMGETYQTVRVDMLKELSNVSYGVFKTMLNVNEDPELSSINLENFLNLMEVDDSDKNLNTHFLNFSFKSLNAAKSLAENMLNTSYSVENDKMVGDAYYKLGQFCYNVYKEHNSEMEIDVQREMIVAVIRAIEHECRDAKLFIPCILQLPKLKNNELAEKFDEEIETLPEWIFLEFISQILSNFDYENDCYLDNLVMKIAQRYPNAVYFPLKISYEYYNQKNVRMEKPLVKQLMELVESTSLKRFVDEVSRLCLPENMILYHVRNFKTNVEKKCSYMDMERELQNIQEIIFTNKFSGEEFRKIDEFESSLQQLKTFIASRNRHKIHEKLKEMILKATEIQKSRTSGNGIELHRLSKWLAEFKWLGSDDFIELPGQYHGKSKPFVDSHVKIVRFESKVNIFASKQMPMELKLFGSDGKTYKFIIKYGEDLRQDQRIQQILQLMNNHLIMDKTCRVNQLKIQTYNVIPLNNFCGMLSVIENTSTIRQFIEFCSTSIQVEPTNIGKLIAHARTSYQRFLASADPNIHRKDTSKIYETALQKYSKEEIVDWFGKVGNLIPRNVLTGNLQRDAICPETFYILRKNFINSLVTMNIAHWILGVGDRHLSNTLIEKNTGTLIGIDFGLAFGAGTRNLPIPELMPFRLTTQFVNILEPIGISGLVRKNMIHTLRCFRNNSDAIVTYLDIFTKEPSIDWLMESKKIQGGTEQVWDPETRVKMSERKLLGANPRKVMEDELNLGLLVQNPSCLEAYRKILNGEKGLNIRADLPDDNLSADQQVSCLIEQATDQYILAATYYGWDPWF